jgi:hypothetical protein
MIIIASFAILLGVVNVVINIRRSGAVKGWQWRLPLAGLLGMATAGILGAARSAPSEVGYARRGRTPFQYYAEFIFQPTAATMYNLLAFFMASAAFRAFRAQCQATITVGGGRHARRIPLGGRSSAKPWLAKFTDWLMDWRNAAAQRTS